MSERSEYKPWRVLPGSTCQPPTSTRPTRFYGDLLGWSRPSWRPATPRRPAATASSPSAGKMVAGYGPVQQEGQPPAWASYIRVEATPTRPPRKVKDAGGHGGLRSRFDLPADSGRMAICHGLRGRLLRAVSQEQQHARRGARQRDRRLDLEQPDDARRGSERRTSTAQVFGWTRRSTARRLPSHVLMWQVEGQRWPEGLGGLMRMGSDMPLEAPPHWQVYFLVPDLDAAIETTKSAGGNLLVRAAGAPDREARRAHRSAGCGVRADGAGLPGAPVSA